MRFASNFTALALSLSLGLSAQNAADPDMRLWSVDLDVPSRQYGISRSGLLWIVTDTAVAAWRTETGQPAWRIDVPSTVMAGLADDRGVLYSGKGLVAVDLDGGKRLWTLDTLPFASLKELYAVSDDVLLAMGVVDEKVFRVAGIEIRTGRLIWQSDSISVGEKIKTKDVFSYSYVTGLPDGSVILQFNRGGIVRVDTRTGAVLWRLDTKPPFTVGWPASSGYDVALMLMAARPLVSGNHLVTTSGAIDISTGAVAWRVPEKPAGWISSLTLVSAGVLAIRASAFDKRTLQLIDPATGRSVWKTPVALKGNLPVFVSNDVAYVAADRSLVKVSVASGEVLAQAPLPDFTSREEPIRIDSIGEDLLMSSQSNLMRVTPAGAVVFHRHYGIPPVGLRPLMTTVMPSTRNPKQLTFIHTNDSDRLGQKGIVLIDVESGRELGTVRRKDRAPNYAIDAITQTAVGIDNRKVTGYRFAPLPGNPITAPQP